jgi:glutaredoxin-like protein
MALIAPADQERLRQDFLAMRRPVRLLFVTRAADCETCEQTRDILTELPPLSPLISIEEVDFALEPERAGAFGIDRAPAIALLGEDEAGNRRDSHIRFLGAPSGYEFISMVRAILLVGGGASNLSAENRTRVAAVSAPKTIHVFSTPTCPHCPRAVVLAHEMAFLNPLITAYAVEATEFPDLARRYRVTGVPKTVVDDSIEMLGALPEDDFVLQALGLQTADSSQDAGLQ